EVSIKVNLLSNVLTAPVQAVAQREGKHCAYVLKAGVVERREVTIGENNDKYVEVREGLSVGEAVCLDARARMNAETQGGAAGGTKPDSLKLEPSKPDAPKPTAPPPAAAPRPPGA